MSVGQQAAERGAGKCADLCKEVGAMPSWNRRGSGEPMTSKPNAGASGPADGSRSASSAMDSVVLAVSTTPSVVADATETELADVSHWAASKPVFGPQYAVVRPLVKERTSSLVVRANSACAYGSATSHTRRAACGTSKISHRPAGMVFGSACGSRS